MARRGPGESSDVALFAGGRGRRVANGDRLAMADREIGNVHGHDAVTVAGHRPRRRRPSPTAANASRIDHEHQHQPDAHLPNVPPPPKSLASPARCRAETLGMTTVMVLRARAPGSGSGQPRWGWHQLDRRWAARLVALADVSPGDLVLDVGAGSGVITTELLRAGAHVVAIELHEQRVAFLREQFDGRRVTVVRADATDLRIAAPPVQGGRQPAVRRDDRAAATGDVAVEPARARRASCCPRGPRRDGRWTRRRAPARVHVRARPAGPASAFRPPPPNDPRVLLVRRAPYRCCLSALGGLGRQSVLVTLSVL